VRKRPIVLVAAAAVAGLAVLGTVVAQPPGGYGQPKASGTPPTTTRPYSDWTPTTPGTSPAAGLGNSNPTPTRPAGGSYLPPQGGQSPSGVTPSGGIPANRPPLGGQVQPAGAVVPPPSMDLPGTGPSTGAQPPRPLPPPSLSVESGDTKFSPPLVPGGGTPPSPPAPAPYVPVPPAPGGVAPPVLPPAIPAPPAFPTTPVAPPSGVPSLPTPPLVTPSLPGPGSTLPAVPPAPSGFGTPTPAALPSRVSQTVSVEAVCPESVVFNTDCRYEIVVRNASNVAVQNVRVEDEIPAGAKYVGSVPPGEVNGDKLVWALGTMDSNTEKRIVITVRPTEEGELRSRASVTYSASVDAKTKVTRPRVAVTVLCPEVTRAGEEPVFTIKVTNSGTGPAEKMVLQALLSEGLDHRSLDRNKDSKLETKLASLAAGESKEVKLPLSAVKAGLQTCQISVTAEGCSEATAKASVNVVEPQLQIAQTGPVKCLVRAEPTYEITLSNPGTAPTDAITVHSVLPDGFDFVQASDTGTYNAASRAVTWKLSGLPAGGTKAVGIKLRAGAAGDVVLRTVAIAASEGQGVAPAGGAVRPGRVIEVKSETVIKAEGVAALRFDVAGLENPVEVGKEAIYEIRIVNQGTGACTNVQIAALLADGTTYTSSAGPTTGKATGQSLVFEPLPSLAVKGETVYRVKIRGTVDGDKRFRVQLTCDQVKTPVQKEESTRFYKE